jgi:hypothetical protein
LSKGYNLSNSGNHFAHVFGLIGPTGAEIRPVEGLRKNWPFSEAFINLLNSTRYCKTVKSVKSVKIFTGSFHESLLHVRTKFSIVDISVTIGPGSNLSLICDHVIFCVQIKIKVNLDAGSLFFGAKAAKYKKLKSFKFSAKDGTTGAGTKVGKLLLLSRIQILVDNLLENTNIFNIRVSTDKCFKSGFGSIRAKMAEIESIEVLELLYTRIFTFNTDDRAFVLVLEALHVPVVEANASDPHAKAAKVAPYAHVHVHKCAVVHNFC